MVNGQVITGLCRWLFVIFLYGWWGVTMRESVVAWSSREGGGPVGGLAPGISLEPPPSQEDK